MDGLESLSHSKWECKYHVVFIPKRRRKTLYGGLRKHLGEVFHRLAGQKGEPDRRRASEGRSRPHVDRDSAEVRGVAAGGVPQGEACHPACAGRR